MMLEDSNICDLNKRSYAHRAVIAFFLFAAIGLVVSMLGIEDAHARAGYAGAISSVEASHVTVSSGEARVIRVKVVNNGSETWYRDGANYISAYTYDPKYHVSPFRGPKWRSDHQVGTLMEKSVAPGQTGTLEMFVFGPPGFEGELVERFRVSAEDVSWIGSSFAVSMTVTGDAGDSSVDPSVIIAPLDDISPSEGERDAGYDGFLLIKSSQGFVVRANDVVSLRAGFKNSGTKSWSAYELTPMSSALAVVDDTSYYHPSWTSKSIATSVTGRNVLPGRVEWVDLTFRAPHKTGSYTAAFQLVVDGVVIPNAILEIPVDVTSNAAEILDAPKKIAPLVQTVYREGVKIEEPRVRVGIEILDAAAAFTANTEVTVVESDVGYERFVIPAGQNMEVAYNGSQYVFKSGDILHIAASYLRFEGKDENTIFTISSRSDVRTWNTSLNDNTFRDTIEIRHNDVKNRTWMINELPIEHYLYGIDETSDYAPEEYHKTMYTAARTYATYAWETKTKYSGEFIDMRSSTYDQVYHGYGAEIRRPNVVRAVNATVGQTIEYGGETIIASYFSRSDGRTRSWKSVWGREVPYAQSVSVPCEAGRVKWGHGVGLSAGGALCMADDGSTYDKILKHFYTGVELVKSW